MKWPSFAARLRLVALHVSAGTRQRSRFSRSELPFVLGLALASLVLALAPSLRAGYKIENIAYPAELRGGIASVAFTPGGTLVIATRYGEIWMRRTDGAWRLFARGLDEPMGLIADSERVVYVAHRPELLRATDTDGDGRADTFDAIVGKWGQTIKYHEFF